jgi:micrococcal nuclease
MPKLTVRRSMLVLVLIAAIVSHAPRPDSPETIPAPAQPSSAVPEGAETAVVERVVDGDTIWVVADRSETRLKVRLLEIDAPEVNPRGGEPECGALEAAAFAREELPVGSVVHLQPDVQDSDRYGRYLRYVWDQEGELYNEKAVRLGHARAVLYRPSDLYIARLRRAEAEARLAERGLWSQRCASR